MSDSPPTKQQQRKKAAGRPKDAGKAAAVLAAARARFLRDGLRGTSVDAVAADAGVSKVTVYSHFGDKDSLFLAVMREQARCLGWQCGEADHAATRPPRTLAELRAETVEMGVTLLRFLARPELVDCQRLLMAEAQNSASLGQRFWEFGPNRAVSDLAALLGRGASAGLIRLRHRGRGPTAEEAAERLIGMWKGMDDTRVAFGLSRRVKDHVELHRHIGQCVDDFLKARAVE